MEVSHENDVLESTTLKRLGQFVRQRQKKWQTAGFVPDFEEYEAELHEHIMAVERELIAEELRQYDVEVAGRDINSRKISFLGSGKNIPGIC